MLKYIFLGMLQGVTEFLPVSSSGHLVIMQKLFGLSGEEIALTLVLHLGSVAAVVIFFYKDIIAAIRDRSTLLLILVVTLITGAIGLAGKDFFERLFTSWRLVALALIFNGLILIWARKFMESKSKVIGIKDAIILGFTQAIAIIPGISRSGITISTLLFRKVDRQTSFKFSFLIFLPAIIGATILESGEIGLSLRGNAVNLTAGFFASLIFGLLALWVLRLIIRKTKLHYFGYYCILIGVLSLLFIK
jgi:undecaprenyl-diphosphatase